MDKNAWHKDVFITSDDYEEYEGWTDDTLYNGWANVLFTEDQVKAYLNSIAYDYKIFPAGDSFTKKDYPVLLIYWDDHDEFIESSPIPTSDGFLVGYPLPAEWMKLHES